MVVQGALAWILHVIRPYLEALSILVWLLCLFAIGLIVSLIAAYIAYGKERSFWMWWVLGIGFEGLRSSRQLALCLLRSATTQLP